MSVESEKFIESAFEYLKMDGEIHRRNAMSRAYFGFYHSVQESLVEIFPEENLELKHQGLIDFLKNKENHTQSTIDSKVLVKLGIKLAEAKVKRHDADYKLNNGISPQDSEYSVKHAKQSLEFLWNECVHKRASNLEG
ncbi:hypothetical protein [Idiomarina abyssalis]|uniref:hypothetical protein n=1 Tax=Idiomarina abyssalis TaxID=86102 RepID=UPI003A8CFCF5